MGLSERGGYMNYERIKQLISESNYMVCLLGRSVTIDAGCDLYREEFAYETEMKYGYSPEEMFSTEYFTNRTQRFFEFYRDEVLMKRGEPGDCLRTLARMEHNGLMKMIVTREIFNLPQRAGCRRVISLHGNIFENRCPRCFRPYDSSYILEKKPVPVCESCGAVVKPGVCLKGEALDNLKITEAANEIAKADVILLVGCHMKTNLASNCLKYFKGHTVILVNKEKHYSDSRADYVFIGNPDEILPQFYP